MMAEQDHAVIDNEADFAEHEKTFATFTWLVKWACIVIALILILMAFFLLR